MGYEETDMRHKPEVEADEDGVTLLNSVLRSGDKVSREPRTVAKEDLRAVVEKNKHEFEAAVAKFAKTA